MDLDLGLPTTGFSIELSTNLSGSKGLKLNSAKLSASGTWPLDPYSFFNVYSMTSLPCGT